jgi:spore coat protein CotF
MKINLTSKERKLLEDQKTHEEICVQKYSNYADQASDQQLKNIFQNHAKIEQEHLNSVNQLLAGQIPSMGGGQGVGTSSQSQNQSQQMQGGTAGFQASDKDLCNDMLMTEKYVSGAYDTAIFEFRDTQVRDLLNHIQKEEQKHGEAIFKYMENKGMYSPQ